MKLKHEILYSIIQIFTISVLLFLLYMVYKSRSHTISDNVFIKDISNNWFTGPINSIISVNKNETCPANYEQMINEKMVTQYEGCDCRKSFYYGFTSDIFMGQCTYAQKIIGCSNIMNEDENGVKLLKTWKNVNLCVDRMKLNYFDILPSVKSQCPADYKQCGLDSNHFGLCFPSNIECPINNIMFSNYPNLNNNQYNNKIKLNEDWYIYYSNKFTNNSLYVNFKYSEGRICINPKEKNLKENFLYFKHNNNYNFYNTNYKIKRTCLSKLGKITFDERYTQVDSTSKFKFYMDNHILDKVENLANYKAQEMINSHSYLFSRSYIYWSPHCNEKNNLEKLSLINEILNLTVFDGFFDVLIMFTIVMIVFFIVFVPLGKIFKFNYNVIVNFLFLILSIVFLIVTITVTLLVNRKFKQMNKMSNFKCGDYITNHSFNRVVNDINKLCICGLKMIIGQMITIVLFLMNLFLIKNINLTKKN